MHATVRETFGGLRGTRRAVLPVRAMVSSSNARRDKRSATSVEAEHCAPPAVGVLHPPSSHGSSSGIGTVLKRIAGDPAFSQR